MADVTIHFDDVETKELTPKCHKLANEMAVVLIAYKEQLLELVCITPFSELQEKKLIKLSRMTNKKLNDLKTKYAVKISYEGKY